MPLPSMGSGQVDSFVNGNFASHFPQKDVVVVRAEGTNEEQRVELRALVNSSTFLFDVNAQVFEGDIIELPDPRGGVQRLHVSRVEIKDYGSDRARAGMSHLRAHYATKEPAQAPPSAQYNAPVINVTNGNSQVAWNNQTVTQEATAGSSGEDLAGAIRGAIDHLSNLPEIDPEDMKAAKEDAELALEELAADEPNQSALRRSLNSLRGIVAGCAQSAANAASSDGASALVAALTLHPDQF